MQALVENKVWTEAELMALPDDGRKYELVEGENVVSNAGIEHEFIGARLIIVLGGFVHGKKPGGFRGYRAGQWMKSRNLPSPECSFYPKGGPPGVKPAAEEFFQGEPH